MCFRKSTCLLGATPSMTINAVSTTDQPSTLTVFKIRDHHPLPNIRLLQSPPYRGSCPADPMADVLGRHLVLLAR